MKILNLEHKQRIESLIESSIRAKGTPYFKIMIDGNTGIYYASPVYRHSDYNKTRVFDKTPETLLLMQEFNRVVCEGLSFNNL